MSPSRRQCLSIFREFSKCLRKYKIVRFQTITSPASEHNNETAGLTYVGKGKLLRLRL